MIIYEPSTCRSEKNKDKELLKQLQDSKEEIKKLQSKLQDVTKKLQRQKGYVANEKGILGKEVAKKYILCKKGVFADIEIEGSLNNIEFAAKNKRKYEIDIIGNIKLPEEKANSFSVLIAKVKNTAKCVTIADATKFIAVAKAYKEVQKYKEMKYKEMDKLKKIRLFFFASDFSDSALAFLKKNKVQCIEIVFQ